MLFLVEKDFIDKYSKKKYIKGSVFTTASKTRVEELKEKGFLGAELAIKEDKTVVKEDKK